MNITQNEVLPKTCVVQPRAANARVGHGARGGGGGDAGGASVAGVGGAHAQRGIHAQRARRAGEGRTARARGGAGRVFVGAGGTRDARVAVCAAVARVARAGGRGLTLARGA